MTTSERLQKATDNIASRVAGKPPFGHKVKLVLSDAGVVFVDGTTDTNIVTNDDGPADLTIESTVAVMQAIDSGELDPFSAFMQGKLSIEGDQGLAAAFGTLIEK